MVGTADPLQKTTDAFGCSYLHDEIDFRPVETQIERGSGDNAIKSAVGHHAFDLAAQFTFQ